VSTTTKFRIYNSCFLLSLLYASETWTLLKADIAKLDFFHITNQRRILSIIRYEFVMNVKVATRSQLSSINEAISRRRHSLFGHVRLMDQAAPAHQALHPWLSTVWHLEKTTRPSAKMLGGADHHENRALSFRRLECCNESVSMESTMTHRRSSVEKENAKKRETTL